MKKLERSKKFGQRLVEVREKFKKKGKEIAELLGVTPVTLSRFEKSERTPDVMQMKALAEAMPVNLHWLITGNGEKDLRLTDEATVSAFEIIRNDQLAEGRIFVPGGADADMVYQLQDMWMSPRIMEDDYVFVEWEKPSVNDLVAFRDECNHVRVGWLRKVKGERERYLVAENPENGRIIESKCEIIGRVIFSVRVNRY